MPRTIYDQFLDHSEEAMGWLADSIRCAREAAQKADSALEEMQLAELEVRRLNRAVCDARRINGAQQSAA
jgi:hypothetical protein